MADDDVQRRYDELNRRVFELHRQGRFAAALAPAEAMCELAAEHNGGSEGADYATCLNLVAELYHEMGLYDEAAPRYRRCIEIRRATLGPDDPLLALSLNNLGHLDRNHGHLAAAEAEHREALAIRRRALPEDDPDIPFSLTNLAEVLHGQGRFEESEALFREAIELRRRILAPSHPDLATSLNGLGLLYNALGRYAEAEPLFREAVEIWRGSRGELPRQYSVGLNNLAMLCRATGRYEEAVRLHLEGLEIVEGMLGEAHPEVLLSLNNLAEIYREIGQYAKAEPLYLRVLELGRPTLGEATPSLATSLNNLAALYRSTGRFDEAEPLYRRAAEIRRDTLGADHPDYASSLSNLALLLEATGRLDEAAGLHAEALAIRRRTVGERHLSYALSLNNLGVLHRTRGEDDRAEPLYRQALEIRREALGEDHPLVAESLSNLAILCAATERTDEALDLMHRAVSIRGRVLGQVFAISSESARGEHLRSIREGFDAFLALVRTDPKPSPASVRRALDLVLGRKAVGTEAVAAQRDAILRGRYPELAADLRALDALRRRIGEKALAGPGEDEDRSRHEAALRELDEQRERLETDLAQRIPILDLQQRLRDADHRAVARALPEKAVLVELVRMRDLDPRAAATPEGGSAGRQLWRPARYLAFVLAAAAADAEPAVRLVDLGEAAPIEEAVARFRRRIVAGGRDFDVGSGSGLGPGRSVDLADGQALRAALIDPLLRALGGCRRLLIAPDAALSLLPFETLPGADGGPLLPGVSISYVTSGRDVLRFADGSGGAGSDSDASEALVVADPDYDLRAAVGSADGGEVRDAGSAPPSPWREALRRSGLSFDRLPATAEEGRRVAALLGDARLLLREAAVEAEVKAVRSPRVLHVATHGFFLADRPAADAPRLGLRSLERDAGGGWSVAGMSNPLLRSGLALAGANTWLRGDAVPRQAEDGILTAEDVAGMDLLDCELVVLSACETGVGELEVGEGVFGLRRSFVLAGARSLVMSLWKVPDRQTRELMEDFYRHLRSGLPRADALAAARARMRERHPDPLYWGAFICQGNPAAMDLPAPASGTGAGLPGT